MQVMTAMQTAKATQTVPDTGNPTQPILCYLNSCFVLSKILRVCSKQTFCPRSYGLEEEDDENLDENDDAIDAPAVSGCAGPSRLCNLLNSRIFTQVQAKKKKPAWPMLTTNLLETPRESCVNRVYCCYYFTHTIQVKFTMHWRLWHAMMQGVPLQVCVVFFIIMIVFAHFCYIRRIAKTAQKNLEED